MEYKIIKSDCEKYLHKYKEKSVDLTFLDPPFNQNKEYNSHSDNMPPDLYWSWMKRICSSVLRITSEGGAIYFMQREKNTKFVMDVLDSTGWNFQNLIIWRKKSSAVPCATKYGKNYQIIVFAINGKVPRVFNKLRIDPPLLETEKYRRPNGKFVTDVWDDIRELTSGYFAGEEPIRFSNGDRSHKQQTPIRLITRIILSSTKVGDIILDPFAGTGTTLVTAMQLQRKSLGVELDEANISIIKERCHRLRVSDILLKFRQDYHFTPNLDSIWPLNEKAIAANRLVSISQTSMWEQSK